MQSDRCWRGADNEVGARTRAVAARGEIVLSPPRVPRSPRTS
jgi:hypothetical protein